MAPLTHLEVVTAPLVNHAMAHNGIRVVRQITLVSSPDLDGGHTDVVLNARLVDAHGLIAYRDIARAVIADDGDIDLLNVYDIAQKPALQVSQHLEVRYLARLMIQYSVKRVLVIDNNELQGFVSITDVVGSLMERALHEQDR